MPAVLSEVDALSILDEARQAARAAGLNYAGDLTPQQAWALFDAGKAVLVDVRSTAELRFVGRVPGSVHVPWADGIAFHLNPRFAEDLAAHAGADTVVLLLCRSGKRSVSGAEVATAAGFRQVYNVLEGFEGDLDATRRRGNLGGWRHHGLPWEQD